MEFDWPVHRVDSCLSSVDEIYLSVYLGSGNNKNEKYISFDFYNFGISSSCYYF